MAEPPAEPSFARLGPETLGSPVILSVPHAGRAYSAELLKASRLPREALETLEDPLVDQLVEHAARSGNTVLVAHAPRAEIDLNRDEREIDAAMVVPPPPARTLLSSPRTLGGLGLVPSRISGAGSIWLQRLPRAQLDHRLDTIHRPYHAALAELLEEARLRFGTAILLDCHSMPPRAGSPGPAADLIFGDRYGTSIATPFLRAALEAARAAGFTTACNAPYAGGFITSRHGRPAAGIHALQLEIDRSLYLEAGMRSPGPGFDRVARLIAAVAQALADRVTQPPQALAAE